MWAIAPNMFVLWMALTWLATPSGAVILVNPSCNEFAVEIRQLLDDVEAVVGKAYRRLLAIKTGDTKAAAIYQTLYGKDSDPEDRIDEKPWSRHFVKMVFPGEDFTHPGRVIDVFDRLRHVRESGGPPISVECGHRPRCDQNLVASMANPRGPKESGSRMFLCSKIFTDKRGNRDTRPASQIAQQGLKTVGSLTGVAFNTQNIIHELTHAISIGGGFRSGELWYPGNVPFVQDWAYGFEACYDLANHPNPLLPHRQPVGNADTYTFLAVALYLDEYDWTTGEVDTTNAKPIPLLSWRQKLDREVRNIYLSLAQNSLTAGIVGGSNDLSPRYRKAEEAYLESMNPNVRRFYRGQWKQHLVENYQVPEEAAGCLANLMIPLKKRPRLRLLDPKVVEYFKQCDTQPLEPCSFTPPNYCKGNPPSTVPPAEKLSPRVMTPLGPAGKQPRNGIVASNFAGKQPSDGKGYPRAGPSRDAASEGNPPRGPIHAR
ncbi:MAG: Peroxisome biosynthesis protein pex1 [Watsoniomyces obsoletus]|nr:MAG: Peroxisome biosynthesis protein pex1 [Watsoniomyces obsoletus]